MAEVCNCPPIKQFTCCWMPLYAHARTHTQNNKHVHAQNKNSFSPAPKWPTLKSETNKIFKRV
jgi:hypothetical protein